MRIAGNGTRDVVVAGCFISATAAGGQPAGVILENNAQQVTLTHNSFFGNTQGVVIKDGAKGVTLQKSIF